MERHRIVAFREKFHLTASQQLLLLAPAITITKDVEEDERALTLEEALVQEEEAHLPNRRQEQEVVEEEEPG
jgi:hypothetical protein